MTSVTTNTVDFPVAKKIPHKVGAQNIVDEYSWLRDPNWPKQITTNHEILGYLNDENNHANKFFDQFKPQSDQLFEELKARIKLEDKSVEVKYQQYYYYTKTYADKQYPIYCRRHNQTEEILLDVNQLAQGKKYTSVRSFCVFKDQKFAAYCVDHDGSERYILRILNLQTMRYVPCSIENIRPNIVWHESINGIFYCRIDENWRCKQVRFCQLDLENQNYSDQDQLVITKEQDLTQESDLYELSLSKTSNKKYLLINISGKQENQIYTLDLNSADLSAKLFTPIRENILYDIDHHGQNFYIHTNDKGSNFRLAICDIQNTENQYWREFLPLDEKRYLNSFDLTQNYLIVNYKTCGLTSIEVTNIANAQKQIITFPDQVYEASGYSTNFEENDIRVNYSSLKRPHSVYSYNFITHNLDELKMQEVPSGFNPDDYNVQRLWCDSDGIKVPCTILYKKSLFEKDGSNPCYLEGYGSYGIPFPVGFRTNVLSLVNRGFVYAIAHVRGGSELGYKWYEDAKFLNKKRTFQDFIAVTLALIEQKYTTKGQIVISGGSAGGMLVANVINQRADLYKGVIAHVPFVDVLNTMLDDTLPLTQGEFKEWGNPKDPIFFDYIKSYSPYDNVISQNYPNIFTTASISDPRVGYYEPAKWVAKLRELKTDNNLLLFKTNMDAGHQGGSGRFEYLNEIVRDYIYVFYIFNINI